MSLLGKLRLGRRKLKVADLSSWRIHGGPVKHQQQITHPFLGERSTRLRSIIWKSSGDSDAIVWRIGRKTEFEVFTDREKVSSFYHQKMRELRAEMLKEAEEIRARFDQAFEDSWRAAKRVYFYQGFRVTAVIGENSMKINRKLLGVLKGPCPDCNEEGIFDGRDAFSKFLEELDQAIDSEGWMQSHSGHFSSYGGQPTRIPCPNCRTYPSVTLEAQANKTLLREMIRRLGK